MGLFDRFPLWPRDPVFVPAASAASPPAEPTEVTLAPTTPIRWMGCLFARKNYKHTKSHIIWKIAI